MTLSAKNIVLVLAAALVAGLNAFVSDFHPGATTLAAIGLAISVLNALVQSPLDSQQAPCTVAPSAGVEANPSSFPKASPLFIKDNRHGFASMRSLTAMCVAATVVLAIACTQQQAKSVETLALTVEQDTCANAAIFNAVSPIAAEVVAAVCGIAAPFIPVIQAKIDSMTLARLVDAGFSDAAIASVKH